MSDNVVPFRGGLSRAAAERRIRELAADTAALNFPWGVAKQMAKAEISMRQVIGTLRHGAVVENPARNEHGDWVCALRIEWAAAWCTWSWVCRRNGRSA